MPSFKPAHGFAGRLPLAARGQEKGPRRRGPVAPVFDQRRFFHIARGRIAAPVRDRRYFYCVRNASTIATPVVPFLPFTKVV